MPKTHQKKTFCPVCKHPLIFKSMSKEQELPVFTSDWKCPSCKAEITIKQSM